MTSDNTPRIFDAVIRVSRRNGRDGESFMSPAEQRAAITKRAEADGVTISAWHDETDSVSGGSVDRDGLQAAITRAVQGATDGILVAKVDRFARTVQGGLSAINTLQDAGKQLWSAREGVIVGDARATATDKLIRTFFLMLAEWQRDTLAEGWEATRRSHIGRGVANHAPYGYVKPGKDAPDRRLVPCETESPWVAEIFQRRAARASWASICDWLTEAGAAPRAGGGAWSVSSVKQIVANRAYLGELRSGEIVNTRAHEPLVDPVLFERANTVATTQGPRRASEPFLLTSVIRCASCGVRMFGLADRRVNAAGDEVVYRVYRCRGRHGAWGRCPAPARVNADEVEAIVAARFRETFLNGKIAVPSEATERVTAAERELDAAERELEAFVEIAAAVDADLFARGLTARQERREQARVRLAEVRSAALGVALPVGLEQTWDGLSTVERQPYIADAFAVVAVQRGKEPAAERTRAWLTGDPAAPSPLPGVAGCGKLTPIV